MYDTANCFNTTTNTYTPSVAGYYQINAYVYYNNNAPAGQYQIYLIKNNANPTIRGNGMYSTGTGSIGCSIAYLIQMNGTTDYITIKTTQESGTTQPLQLGADLNWFNGVMIRPL